MWNKAGRIVAALLLCGGLCAPATFAADPTEAPDEVLRAGFHAGDVLHKGLRARSEKEEGPILVATLANLENLDDSSPFGRVATQQVASRLGQLGHAVVESRLQKELIIDPRTGEMLLSRDATRLAHTGQYAWGALVGSYSQTAQTVFVSMRIVRLADGVVMAATEYRLSNAGDVHRLLANPNAGSNTWQKHAMRQPAFMAAVAQQPVGDAHTMQPVQPATAPALDPASAPVMRDFPAISGGRYIPKDKPAPAKPVAKAKPKPKSKPKPKPVAKTSEPPALKLPPRVPTPEETFGEK